MTTPATDLAEHLDDAVEAEWARLHDQIELADGFWLAWVFSVAFDAPRVMAARVRATLQAQGRQLRRWRPETPKALQAMLPVLLSAAAEGTGDCLWVEALAVDPPSAAEDESWMRAWRELHLRANERRERFLRTHRGGLIFVGPPEVKVLAREHAPDLWAIRAMVIDMPRAVVPTTLGLEAMLMESVRAPLREEPPPVTKELTEAIRRAAGDALVRARDFMSAARPLISWAYVLLDQGRAEEARALMIHLFRLDREGDGAESPFVARALAVLARCAASQGDAAAAAGHLRGALRGEYLVSAAEAHEWAMALVGLLVQQKELDEAQQVAAGASLRARSALALDERDVASLRALGEAQLWLGRVDLMRQDFRGAEGHFKESSACHRRLLERQGDRGIVLRGLFLSLQGEGIAALALRDVSRADASFEELLALAHRMQTEQGDEPETLRDVINALVGIGVVRLFQRRLDEAKRLLSRAQELVARLREMEQQGVQVGPIPLIPPLPDSFVDESEPAPSEPPRIPNVA